MPQCLTEIFQAAPHSILVSLVSPDHSRRRACRKPPGTAPFSSRSTKVLETSKNNGLGWLGDQDSNLNDPNCNSLKSREINLTRSGRDKKFGGKAKFGFKGAKRDERAEALVYLR